jgi:hypothetical protein
MQRQYSVGLTNKAQTKADVPPGTLDLMVLLQALIISALETCCREGELLGLRWADVPRRPQPNGKVERSHRIDQEEFWSQHDFASRTDADTPLADWERRYNHDRFSLALQGRTPVEKLQAKRAAHHTSVQ